jgi:hypothetical protein
VIAAAKHRKSPEKLKHLNFRVQAGYRMLDKKHTFFPVETQMHTNKQFVMDCAKSKTCADANKASLTPTHSKTWPASWTVATMRGSSLPQRAQLKGS